MNDRASTSLSDAEFDDRLDALVTAFIEDYRSADWPEKEKEITKTQLAALISVTETVGAAGLGKLIHERRQRDDKNAKAVAEKKGGKPPSNPTFWKVLERVAGGELAKLAEERGDLDGVHVAFAHRLAIEWSYRKAPLQRRGS